MGAAFLITLREGLEIALVLAILVSYLVKSERRADVVHVWKGSGVAVGFCVVAGLLFHWFVGEFEGKAEQFIETQVKFEDGRTGSVSATLKITDAKTFAPLKAAA